jgi:hypothetical protein
LKLAATVLAALSVAYVALGAQPPADPLAFFRPSVELSAGEIQRLRAGASVVRVLRASGREVAVFGAAPIHIDGDRLVSWVRHIAALKKSRAVLGIARVSDPPRLEDFDHLVLDDADLEEIRQCRPGDCGLKITADEIGRLHAAIGGGALQWKPRVQQVFRELMLRRIRDYLAGGSAALPRYDDGKDGPLLGEVFRSIARQTPIPTRLPRFADYLERYPHAPAEDVESFIYWAKEEFGRKPVVSATHVSIVHPSAAAALGAPDGRPHGGDLPTVVVTGRQLFATHYLDGALSVTAILGDRSQYYLAYLNRTRVDSLGGFLGPFVRSAIERRLKKEASELLPRVRDRLESGEPPS